MELLLHQWGDWPELYRNTDKTEATEIVIIDSQMNYRGKLDTYRRLNRPCISSPIYGILKMISLILCKDERKYMDGTGKASPDGGSGYGNFMEVPL